MDEEMQAWGDRGLAQSPPAGDRVPWPGPVLLALPSGCSLGTAAPTLLEPGFPYPRTRVGTVSPDQFISLGYYKDSMTP